MRDYKKICLVSPNIIPINSNQNKIEIIGGAELQQYFIGKGLRENGFGISYVTPDYGQPDEENVDGFAIFKTYKPTEGIFGLRFFYPRLHLTWKALKKADADIYFVRAETYLLGIVAFFCKIYKKKLIFSGAHDSNFIPSRFKMTTKYKIITVRDKFLYLYGLRRADFVIVQSEYQKNKLWDNFHKKGEIVHSFHPFDPLTLNPSQREYILWVATIRSWKRPSQFISLAKAFPQEKFIMIGGRDFKDRRLYDLIRRQSEKVKNLQFLGYQSIDVTESYFDRCKVFVNTSKYEGFPNTFLQAWRRGIPVISYVDPDGVIQSKKLGEIVKSEDELYRALSETLPGATRAQNHIQNYFVKNHSSKVIDKYSLILKNVLLSNQCRS